MRKSAVLLLVLAPCAKAQFGLDGMGTTSSAGTSQITFWWLDYARDRQQKLHDQQEKPSEGVSKLDLKAPDRARKAYEDGVKSLLNKDLDRALERLSRATMLYPNYVAAHNALGITFMDLGRNEEARAQFQQAVTLDDHLPNPLSNLCSAAMALKDYATAEQAIKKASSIEPLNQEFLTTLTYAQVLNHNYQDAIATAPTGDRALIALADQSGGAFFSPGSVSNLKRSLAELQQVIRSRYLIAYKPANFQANGSYRKVELTARKSGRKLGVYARKGYYARENAPGGSNL